MALRARDVLLAGVAGFVAWGYATHWFPAIRFAGHGIVLGAFLSCAGLLALALSVRLPIYATAEPIGQQTSRTTSGGSTLAVRAKALGASALSRPPINPPRRIRPPVAFVAPEHWSRERAALRARLEYSPEPLYPPMPRVSAAIDTLLASILRQNVRSWYSNITSDPSTSSLFPNQVEVTIRGALGQLRDRLLAINDVVEVLTGRLVPLLTAHFHDFNEAERAVRGRKLNRSVTESDELDLAIAAKYRELREARAATASSSGTATPLPKGLHPAAQLSYSAANTRTVQQEYLRRLVGERLLPELLPAPFLASRPVAALVREIVACAVLYPLMQTLSEPDTWNQLMENYGRTMLQDRSTVRRLRAALDRHASSTAVIGGDGNGNGRDSAASSGTAQGGSRDAAVPAFPRLAPGDSERRFERFVRAVRKINNLSDARRLRSEVASQLKRDSQQQIQDLNSGNSNSNPELVVYLRRLEMSKRLLDQKVQYLASGGGVRGGSGLGAGAGGANGSFVGGIDGLPGAGTPGGGVGIGANGAASGAGGAGNKPLAVAAMPTVSRLETASLAELLRDASALSYFMEYMDRQRLMPLVQFWLVVDGFRNPLEEEDEEEEEGGSEKNDAAVSAAPAVFPPWTESDRLDLAQIDQAYLARPELHISAASRKAVRAFLESGKGATPEQYYLARRAILRCQTAVLNEMKAKHLQGFKKSDLFYKCLAAEEAAQQRKHARNSSATAIERTIERVPSPLNRAASPANAIAASAKAYQPNPSRKMPRMHTTDMRTSTTAASKSSHDDPLFPPAPAGRRSLDGGPSHTPNSPSPLFGDDDDFFAHPRGGGRSNLSNSTGHLPPPSAASSAAAAAAGHDPMSDSVHSLGGSGGAEHDPNVPDTKVVQAVEEALSNIMEDKRPTTAEDLRASLFGSEDGAATNTDRTDRGSIFLGIDADSNNSAPHTSQRSSSTANLQDARRGSLAASAGQHGQHGQHINPHAHALLLHGDNSGKPSLASLGLVSAASRIGVFEDDDLFGDDQAKYLSDDEGDTGSPDLASSDLLEPPAKPIATSSSSGAPAADAQSANSDDDVHEAAPGDLGLVEAIAGLADDIDRLTAQDAVVDSLLKKAELTNNTAELRILRKSKASLQREIRRKELQRQQYVLQETDSSLYGRATVRLTSVHSGKEEDTGKEYAVYVIEVQRLTDSGGAAASSTAPGSSEGSSSGANANNNNNNNTKNTVVWTVARRYSAFWALHQRLRGRYPSVRALDFPRRRVVLNKLQGDFLAKRRVALERYLRALLLLPDVCRSRELRAFLSQRSIERTGRGNNTVATNVTGFDDDRRDVISRLYDSVADGMEDILGSIPVLDQLSTAGQNLIAAAASQLGGSNGSGAGGGGNASGSGSGSGTGNGAANGVGNAASESALEAAEMAAAAATAGEESVAPFVKPICDIFLEVFELNRGNSWLRGRAVVVLLQQLLGGTIERKLRENVRTLLQEEEALVRYLGLVQDALFPASGVRNAPRTTAQKARTRNEAGLMLATLVPDLAGSVVGRVNAQAASRRIFATFNNSRLNAHLMFTILDEAVDVLLGAAQGRA